MVLPDQARLGVMGVRASFRIAKEAPSTKHAAGNAQPFHAWKLSN